jgi:hypothetical protein
MRVGTRPGAPVTHGFPLREGNTMPVAPRERACSDDYGREFRASHCVKRREVDETFEKFRDQFVERFLKVVKVLYGYLALLCIDGSQARDSQIEQLAKSVGLNAELITAAAVGGERRQDLRAVCLLSGPDERATLLPDFIESVTKAAKPAH